MQNYDWSQFTLRIPVKAKKKEIYEYLTTQQGLEKWFLRKAEFTKEDKSIRKRKSAVQKGDTYEWLWHGYGDNTAEHGTVTEANGKDLFRFVFGKAGTVSFSIKSENGETIVELLQENIQTDEQSKINFHVGCMKGWTFYLANLKSVLEKGKDLRNKKTEVKNVVSS